MRIGIVSDIHDAVEPLRRALTELQRRRVDRIVSLGDAFDSWLPGAAAASVISNRGVIRGKPKIYGRPALRRIRMTKRVRVSRRAANGSSSSVIFIAGW